MWLLSRPGTKQDAAYVVEFCLNAELPRLEDVQLLLSHAASKGTNSSHQTL